MTRRSSSLLSQDNHLLPDFRAGGANGVDLVASSPLFAPMAPRATSASPPAAPRRIPHDAAKEGDNFQPPPDLPLHMWIEIEVHHVYDPANIFFQGGTINSVVFLTFLSATEFSVADYDSTPCGVVVVGVKVQIKKWITF